MVGQGPPYELLLGDIDRHPCRITFADVTELVDVLPQQSSRVSPEGTGSTPVIGFPKIGSRFASGARSRNRTGMGLPPADFKSDASTNFAIRAG